MITVWVSNHCAKHLFKSVCNKVKIIPLQLSQFALLLLHLYITRRKLALLLGISQAEIN